VFSQNQLPTDMPEVVVPAAKIGILNLLVQAGLAPSTSEARRLVQAGAVKLDDEKVADFRLEIEPKDGLVIRSGKRGFARLKLET
jgi:tyrosyl-tRNA synthetase